MSRPRSWNHLLGGLDAPAFLREHWQKRPLLVRGALPDPEPPLTAEELAGLACEEEVESRLVLHPDVDTWELRHGPIPEEDFPRLPERDWTLLVQDVDKWVPEAAALLERFRFLPSWRRDDVMLSYAAPGGGVGPHWDDYDVFLVQLQGRRRWRIAHRFDREALVPDCDLRILSRLEPEREWILEPGDMLYLPPGVAHEGTAVDACLTASVGFRAASAAEMLTDLAGLLAQRSGAGQRFADPWRGDASADPGLIDDRSLETVRRLLQQAWAMAPGELETWFGRFITEPKPWLQPEPPAPLTREAFARLLAADVPLALHPASRLAHAEVAAGRHVLFADGRAHRLPPALVPLARRICELCGAVPASHLEASGDAARTLLHALYLQGTLLAGNEAAHER
ncbi:MAG TPA: cupin domain-containing protein [Gammaproteobacteria bacterium]|nr:cupin domain-containing protein [Gammaproteobacteria bacterium]